jgi:hypothetical protein
MDWQGSYIALKTYCFVLQFGKLIFTWIGNSSNNSDQQQWATN